MATTIKMKNPANGLTKTGFHGFSWTTFFFGTFPALFRGDFLTFIGAAVIYFILAIATVGIGAIIAQFVWAFQYNKYYTRKLIEKGFRFDGTPEENALAAKAIGVEA